MPVEHPKGDQQESGHPKSDHPKGDQQEKPEPNRIALKHIEREKSTLRLMVRMYCRHWHVHSPEDSLCPDCSSLLYYAEKRLDQCRYQENKSACKACITHCYKPDMRKRIQEVMRWSGPRMIFRAPLAALRHLWL